MTTKQTYSAKLRKPQWQKKRLKILERDNYACRLCGDTYTELQIHHLEYSKTGNPWDVEDRALTTLCCHCHAATEFLKKEVSVSVATINARKINGQNEVLAVHAINKGVELVYLFLIVENSIDWKFTLQCNTLDAIYSLVHSIDNSIEGAKEIKNITPTYINNPKLPNTSLSSIGKLINDIDQMESEDSEPLEMLKLLGVFNALANEYADENKISRASVLCMAKVSIESKGRFAITVNDADELFFIESSKADLLYRVQAAFNNKNIGFSAAIGECIYGKSVNALWDLLN